MLLAVVAGLLVAADIGVRSVAESQLRDRVVAAVSPGGATSARISSFPFVARLLTSGDVARIRVAAADVTVERLTFATVSVDLQDVTLDKTRLFSERKIVLESLGKGTATAELTQDRLSDALGVPVTLTPGHIGVQVAGQQVTAMATVSDNTLRVTVAGLSVPGLKIPTLPLLPCVANAVVLAGRIRLTCSVDQVPPELVGRPLDEISRP